MNKELRLTIYRAMLDILEQVVLLDKSEDKEHPIIINKRSFKLIKDNGDVYIKRIRKSDAAVIFGYCSLINFLVEFKIYSFSTNTNLENLTELCAVKPSNQVYWFHYNNRKSRIALLKSVINSMEDGKER